MPKMNHNEQWKPVVGCESHYSVSSLGRIRRDAPEKNTRVGKILKPAKKSNGYLQVVLNVYGKQLYRSIARMTCAAFRGPCPSGMQVNHKNGIKDDNRCENLEWVTPLENTRHAIDVLGLKKSGEHNGRAKLRESDVVTIRSARARGTSLRELGEKYGVTLQAIGHVVARRSWKSVA